MNYFANNIKYLRKVHGLKQADLAKKLGKTANAVSNWEQGIRQPIVADVMTLCQIFDIEFNDLINTDLALQQDFTLRQRINKLTDLFRQLSVEQQENIIRILEGMVK